MSIRIGKVNLGTRSDLIVVSVVTTLLTIGFCSTQKTVKLQKKNQLKELKSYNLSKDEFKRLGARILNQKPLNNVDGIHILDSLAQDKKEKQIFKKGFEQGKQFAKDSINIIQQKLANKSFSAKVDTSLKALRK